MASRMCDVGPCDLMKRMLLSLVPPDCSDEYVELLVDTKRETAPLIRVYLRYCPFCGVRLDPHWIMSLRGCNNRRRAIAV
jgi:hypothetical protein